MPDETNDQLGNEGSFAGTSDQQKDGSEIDKRIEDQGMDGQGSVSTDVSTSDEANAKAVQEEEEPVGASRPEPRVIRKMNASDFKIKSEPKPTPGPEVRDVPEQKSPEPKVEETPAHEPVSATPVQKPQEPTPRPEPVARPEPKPEVRSEPARATPPEPEVAPIVEPTPAPEPEPAYSYQEPTPEPTVDEQAASVQPESKKKKVSMPKMSSQKATTSSGGFMGALKGALSFFTIIKMNVDEEEIDAMNKNMYVVPIVGLIIGIIASIVGIIFNEIRAVALAPVAVIATVYIISKFLHFDGLVDFGDGMVVSGDQEDSVRALKDTRIGAGGLGIALIVILATYAALASVWTAYAMAGVIVIMEVFAKNSMVAAAAFGEPGNGMAAEQVRNVSSQTMLMSTIFAAAAAFLGYLLMGVITSLVVANGMLNSIFLITSALLIVGAAVISILTGWLMAYLANKKFGFVNGDVLGATNEVSRVFILIIAIIVTMFYMIPELGGIFI